MISDAGHTVHWWIRNPEKANYIQTHLHNPDYLSSVEIHSEKVIVSNDLQFVLNSCGVIILAVPSAFIHQSLHGVVLHTENIYVSAIKGIEPNTNLVMAKYLEKNHGIPTDQVAIITGPCHAEEVAAEKLSYLTVAANTLDVAQLEMNMVAEGYYASNLIYNKSAKRDLQLPIADAVYRVIYENANAKKTFKVLSDHNLH